MAAFHARLLAIQAQANLIRHNNSGEFCTPMTSGRQGLSPHTKPAGTIGGNVRQEKSTDPSIPNCRQGRPASRRLHPSTQPPGSSQWSEPEGRCSSSFDLLPGTHPSRRIDRDASPRRGAEREGEAKLVFRAHTIVSPDLQSFNSEDCTHVHAQ